jgi:hypothetical protein
VRAEELLGKSIGMFIDRTLQLSGALNDSHVSALLELARKRQAEPIDLADKETDTRTLLRCRPDSVSALSAAVSALIASHTRSATGHVSALLLTENDRPIVEQYDEPQQHTDGEPERILHHLCPRP